MIGKIYGGLSIIFGLLILMGPMLAGEPPPDTENTSNTGSLIFGAGLCLLGFYYLFKKPKS